MSKSQKEIGLKEQVLLLKALVKSDSEDEVDKLVNLSKSQARKEIVNCEICNYIKNSTNVGGYCEFHTGKLQAYKEVQTKIDELKSQINSPNKTSVGSYPVDLKEMTCSDNHIQREKEFIEKLNKSKIDGGNWILIDIEELDKLAKEYAIGGDKI